MKFTFVIPDMSWLYDYKAQFSLGILYLSSAIKDVGGSVDIFDSNVDDISNIQDSDVYGFSVVFNTYNNCVELAKQIKKIKSNSKLILGGVHATLYHDHIDSVFDSIFIGEAEDTIKEYIKDDIKKKKYFSNFPFDVNKYFPDRSILPDDFIRTPSIFTGGKTYDENGSTSIMFTRGCSYNCSFCASPKVFNRRVRFRTVDSIVDEIKLIKENYNIKQFRIQDDTFTVRKSFVKELHERLTSLKIYYRCSTRVNHVSREMVKQLYESGCREIGLGIEVADNDALKIINKQITVEQAEKAIKLLREYPITIRCFFMVGLPVDSKQTMENNKKFIEKNKIENAIFGNFIPFPGTEMFYNKEKYNIKEIKKETCMNVARHINFKPNITRTDITEEEHLNILKPFYEYIVEKEFI